MKPIFICGAPHSGTSLLLKILDTHSNLSAIHDETEFFRNANGDRKHITIHQIYNYKLENNKVLKNKKRWIEKTPSHILDIRRIHKIFPDAQIIICLRNPYNNIASLYQRYSNLNKGIDIWKRWNEHGRPYWKEDYVYVSRLSLLTKRFDFSTKKILNWLNEPYEDLSNYFNNKVDWYIKKHNTEHNILRNQQINSPIFLDENKWKMFNQKQLDKINQSILSVLEYYKYQPILTK